MAFENVDAGSLKSAITSCINSLNKEAPINLKNNFNSNVLQAQVSNHINSSLDSLNGRYTALINYLNQCSAAASSIEKYKELEKLNEELEAEYSLLSEKLYYKVTYEQEYTNENGETATKLVTDTREDKNVANQMKDIKAQIGENILEMSNLEYSINGMV